MKEDFHLIKEYWKILNIVNRTIKFIIQKQQYFMMTKVHKNKISQFSENLSLSKNDRTQFLNDGSAETASTLISLNN